MGTEFVQHSPSINLESEQGNTVEILNGKKVHQLYFIKCWPYDEQNVESRIEEAEKLIEKIDEDAFHINIKNKKLKVRLRDNISHEHFNNKLLLMDLNFEHLEREHLCLQLQRIYNRFCRIDNTVGWNTHQLGHLKELLNQLTLTENSDRRRLPREHVKLMRHNKNNLATERQLLRQMCETESQQREVDSFPSPAREFRQLSQHVKSLHRVILRERRSKHGEKTIQLLRRAREKATLLSAQKEKNWSLVDLRDAVQDHLVEIILEELKKEVVEIRAEYAPLRKYLEVIDKHLSPVMKKCDEIGRRKDEVNQRILNLKRQQAETRSSYQRYVSVMNNARKLSQKKDVKALEELSLRQVGIFISKWNKSEVFRCNYEKSMVQSLQIRQLCRDGRIRNLDNEEEQLLLNC